MANPTRTQQQIQDMINAAVQQVQAAMQQQIDAINKQANNDCNQAAADIAALRNQNTALLTAIAAQQQQQPVQQPAQAAVVPPPVQFAYTPGTYGTAASIIDYNTTNGAKIQKAATEKLDVSHDLDAENLNDFLESFRT